MEERVYFIYRHLRPDTGKPFYIGRGKYNKNGTSNSRLYKRAYENTKRSSLWTNIFKKYGREVEIMMDNLTYKESVDKEIEFIALYGRMKSGGMLCNLTAGGEGSVDFKHSKESLEKMSRDKTLSFDQKLKIKKESNGCWTWEGTVVHGRPMIHMDKRSLIAKRYIYCRHHNLKLTKKSAIHNTCDNSLCVNPDHLIVHQATKHIRDKSPFTEDIIRIIKKELFSGETHADLAKKYKVSRLIITKIANGYNWGWVKVEGIPDVIVSDYHKKNKKAIVCIENGKTYESAKEASIDIFGTNKNLRHIRQICNSKKYTFCKGFNFKFLNE